MPWLLLLTQKGNVAGLWNSQNTQLANPTPPKVSAEVLWRIIIALHYPIINNCDLYVLMMVDVEL